MKQGGFEGNDVYDVGDGYTEYTMLGKSRDFEAVDVYGVNDVYTDYTIFGKSGGCGAVDAYGVKDYYTDNINRWNQAVLREMMCVV